jgi:hypothetical protein
VKSHDDPVELIRRDYPDQLTTPEDFGMTLEPANVFSARMVANDARDRSRRRRVALLATGSVAAAGVLLFGVLQPWRTDSVEAEAPRTLVFQHGLDSQRSATEALESLSRTAAHGAPIPSGSEQHVVTATWSARAGTGAEEPISDVYETVTRQDGSVSAHRIGSISLTKEHEDDLALAGSGESKPTGGETTPESPVDPDFAQNLPSDPDTMRAALLANSSCAVSDPTTPDTRCVLQELTALHSKYVVPSATAATEWAMLAKEDGTTYLGRVRERAGRDAIAISMPIDQAQGTRIVLIADPDDGRLLGVEELNQKAYSTVTRTISVFLRSRLV